MTDERDKLIRSDSTAKQTYQLVVIGDGAVGKTCLLIAYAKNEFPKEYVPTVFDNYVVSVNMGTTPIDLSLIDTAGQEDLASVRKLSYHRADVFVICFSIANPVSFENIPYWVKDVKDFDPSIPFILVGTQVDLRDDPQQLKGKIPVTYDEGVLKQRQVGAYSYVECSALTRHNLNRVFTDALSAILSKKKQVGGNKQEKSGCCVLL